MPDSVPDAVASTAAHPSNSCHEHYTGVVLIHGLGSIKRNTTLEEAVNSLAYWFNHKAGLTLQREGIGRVWVTAQLTDDSNPDAPASRATVALAPPGELATSATGGEAPLQLEFREVWWAESFGVPSVRATIAWARVQALEQARHLLLPIGRRRGPGRTPVAAPPKTTDDKKEGTTEGSHVQFTRTQRFLLLRALGLYSFVQYIWKAIQWLILTPLILLVLFVMGVVRLLLALIPPLQSSVVAGVSALLDTIMLHWVAEAQVYMLDYTRSAGIRERFEREVVDFLRDGYCDRIVVIAHSMGTVIAYEGLTTIFDRPQFHDDKKQVIFICLAQALRRIWLLTADDPHRVRGVLPDRVRWLHFWARYDPVTAGSLDRRALPQLDTWLGSEVPDPYKDLAAQLDRCQNIDVVNTDSAFTDHTTYWQNMEEVVGPIARELVDGHPQLEQVVQAHLATPDDVAVRRAQVAWRATVALVVGFGLGLALLLWDSSQGWMRVGHTLATSFLHFLGDLLGAVASGFGAVFADLQKIIQGLTGGQFPSFSGIGNIAAPISDALWSILAASVLTGVGILVIGRGIALRSPLDTANRVPATRRRQRTLFTLSVAYPILLLVLLLAGGALETPLLAYGAMPFYMIVLYYVEEILYGAAVLCGLVAFVLAIISSSRRRQWGWEATILLFTGGPYILLLPGGLLPVSARVESVGGLYEDLITPAALAGIVVVGVGCLLYLWPLARSRRFGTFTFLVLNELVLLYAVVASVVAFVPLYVTGATFPFEASSVPFYVVDLLGFFMPVLAYALVTSDGALGVRRALPGRGTGLVGLPGVTVVLLTIMVVLAGLAASIYGSDVFSSALRTVIAYGGLGGVALLSLLAVGRAGIDAVQARRWGWVGALPLTVLVMTLGVVLLALFVPHAAVHDSIPFLHTSYITLWWLYPGYLPFLYLFGAFVSAAALAYGLWSGLTLRRPEKF